jgi:glycerophosphoryl diester phosphodiesterase
LIAHRGAGIAAPENTLVSMEYGLRSGYKAVEFDVMLTKDEQPMLMHDDDLGRTIPGTGMCSEFNMDHFTKLDACKWHEQKYQSDLSMCIQSRYVPKFQDILEYCKGNDIWMNVEIKPCPGYEAKTGEIVAATTKQYFLKEIAELSAQMSDFQFTEIYKTLSKLPLLSSFSFESLMHAKVAAPELPRAYLIHDLTEVPNWKEQMVQCGAIAVHTCVHNLTEALAIEIKRLGYGLFLYTVNSLDDWARVSAWGVDSFCTDQLEMFRSMNQEATA